MPSEPNPRQTHVCCLASDGVAVESAWPRLTVGERRRYAELRHPQRRQRWLAGRMATKYLALALGVPGAMWKGGVPSAPRRLASGRSRPCGLGPMPGGEDPTATGRPVLLDDRSLGRWPAWLYRELELDAPRSLARLRPRLRWLDGRPCGLDVSISHGGGWTVVGALETADPEKTPSPSAPAMAGEGVDDGQSEPRGLGLDLEVVREHRPAFYRGNFTSTERAWARRSGTLDPGIRGWGNPAERFTLLWTVKEALLKCRARGLESVWDFPRVEVELPHLSSDVLSQRGRSTARRLGPPRAADPVGFGPLLDLEARVRFAHRTRTLHLGLATGQTRAFPPRPMILSLVTRTAARRESADPIRRTP